MSCTDDGTGGLQSKGQECLESKSQSRMGTETKSNSRDLELMLSFRTNTHCCKSVQFFFCKMNHEILSTRLQIEQLPQQVFPVRGETAFEFTQDDHSTNSVRRVGYYNGILVPLESGGVDVFDAETGDFCPDLKFLRGSGSPNVRPARLRVVDSQQAQIIREIKIPTELHDPAKILANAAITAPIYHKGSQRVYYMAEAATPPAPEDPASLAATSLYNYELIHKTFGEKVECVNPQPFVVDLVRNAVAAIPGLPSNVAARRIVPLTWSRGGDSLELIVQTVGMERKLGLSICINRPAQVYYLRLSQISDQDKLQYKCDQCKLLLSLPYKCPNDKDDSGILAAMLSLMVVQNNEPGLRLFFFASKRPGEHYSDLIPTTAFFQRFPEDLQSPPVVEINTLPNDKLLFLPLRRHEFRRVVLNTPLWVPQWPDYATRLDLNGRLDPDSTIPLRGLVPVSEGFVPGNRELAIHRGLLTPPRVVVWEGYSIKAVEGLPTGDLPTMRTKFEVRSEPSGDVVIRKRDCEKPKHILLWLHGGPNANVSEHDWNPLVAFLLETLQLDMVVLPQYRGSAGTSRCYDLAGAIGSMDVDDCVEAVSRLVSLEDPEVNLIMGGGSHGGFLTGHLLADPRLDKVLRGGVVVNGVTDLNYSLVASDIPDWAIYQTLGSLEESPCTSKSPMVLTNEQAAKLWASSPISKVGHVKVPVCVFCGLKDQRVPPAQSLRYAATVKARLFTYPEDGHALASPRSAFHKDLQILDFFVHECGFHYVA
eukprot:Protomagalhaensia_sp_Gyna_25__3782@NODE_33_length_6954_cov_98_369776_g23_i0_p1_GENE_NODE_33_length_6954_cov_98_369776_g23_i0NODE_33_length_6954_cov_98_369776_g23_i0_p1_ORF_typecomplete_len764_score135_19Peptidase_S9/PF00326_21/3_4e25Hydrolase_4/PF12146_8/2_8e03Hydrolase_4/PF12146_8/6e09Abhydrolase_1/PF00561_20/1_5e07DLH/PF01738_18/2_8e03DLH/PF01738_18/1_5e06Abhydrolase_3/PF07859_13/1_1e06Peptidase_S15/PF02129_18/1_3e05Abhydrolase_2/PF02230_16/0_00025BAAT_C/PF08840_11/0_0042FSH1/PF03959_13/0_0056